VEGKQGGNACSSAIAGYSQGRALGLGEAIERKSWRRGGSRSAKGEGGWKTTGGSAKAELIMSLKGGGGVRARRVISWGRGSGLSVSARSNHAGREKLERGPASTVPPEQDEDRRAKKNS